MAISKETYQRLRKKALFGQPWTVEEQLEVWEMLTGERIQHGRRCNACECSGQQIAKMHDRMHITLGGKEVYSYLTEQDSKQCPNCNGSGYTVRPTWMEEGR